MGSDSHLFKKGATLLISHGPLLNSSHRCTTAEIDKTLKKVTEGVRLNLSPLYLAILRRPFQLTCLGYRLNCLRVYVEASFQLMECKADGLIFIQIFDKIQASSNQTQKEKLETDLKTQIKKLQRLRDQIKTWMASSDVKDKQPLIDNRKLIETVRFPVLLPLRFCSDADLIFVALQQMEKFKACEKEMKTKAFSKEGLSAAMKLDPKEQQKLELCQWIQTMVEELSRQVEQAEAELETIQGVKTKKKDSEREARLEELETLNERRGWHVNRLELILRLLENGNLQTDAVTNVKDDIAYFVESNTVRLGLSSILFHKMMHKMMLMITNVQM